MLGPVTRYGPYPASQLPCPTTATRATQLATCTVRLKWAQTRAGGLHGVVKEPRATGGCVVRRGLVRMYHHSMAADNKDAQVSTLQNEFLMSRASPSFYTAKARVPRYQSAQLSRSWHREQWRKKRINGPKKGVWASSPQPKRLVKRPQQLASCATRQMHLYSQTQQQETSTCDTIRYTVRTATRCYT